MNPSCITPATAAPVPLEMLRRHCGLLDTSQDDLLRIYLAAAVEACERLTARVACTSTWKWVVDVFSGRLVDTSRYPLWPVWSLSLPLPDYTLRVPLAPVQAITELRYCDASDGTWKVIPANQYQVDLLNEPCRLLPLYDQYWPTSLRAANAVEIHFTAGWASPDLVPATFRQAVLLMAAHLFQNREAVSPSAGQAVPFGVEALLAFNRWGRWP